MSQNKSRIHTFTYKAALSETLSCSFPVAQYKQVFISNYHSKEEYSFPNLEKAKREQISASDVLFCFLFIAGHVSSVSMVIFSWLMVLLLICNTVRWAVFYVFTWIHIPLKHISRNVICLPCLHELILTWVLPVRISVYSPLSADMDHFLWRFVVTAQGASHVPSCCYGYSKYGFTKRSANRCGLVSREQN